MGSLRCLAAATVTSSRSFTFSCPVNSEKSDGRRVISRARSGLVKTFEIVLSAIALRMSEEVSRARSNGHAHETEACAKVTRLVLAPADTLVCGQFTRVR